MIKTDILVIGSGFGGAVCAARLVDAGKKVSLLERGAWRASDATRQSNLPKQGITLQPFPHNRHLPSHLLRQVSFSLLSGPKVLNTHGLFDLSLHPQMSVLCSSGVGGGSHVYWSMNMRPTDPLYWNNRATGLNSEQMAAHYDWILAQMGSQPLEQMADVPNKIDQVLAGYSSLHTQSEQPALGFRFRGAYSNHGMLGDATNHKVGLDEQLLLPRLSQGLTVYAEHECLTIRRVGDHYHVHSVDHQQQQDKVFVAKTVVLAAGTVNSMRILFRSRQTGGLNGLPSLGKGFSGNGDVFALWRAGQGTQDFRQSPPSMGRFQVSNQSDAPFLYATGLNILQQVPLLPNVLQRQLKHWLMVVGMGPDAADGNISWGQHDISVQFEQSKSPIFKSIYQSLKQLKTISKRRAWFLSKAPMTVHPLGGARVGMNAEQGVVDGYGEVFGHPNLYITDGSALPAATGTPPSMTIAAWSSHVSQGILQASQESSE
jgi:cholesterol oxidase